MTVEKMLDDNIDPSMAIEMTGLTFSESDRDTRIDPRYIEMLKQVKDHKLVDEELGFDKD